MVKYEYVFNFLYAGSLKSDPELSNEDKYLSLARGACTGIAAQRIAAMEQGHDNKVLLYTH